MTHILGADAANRQSLDFASSVASFSIATAAGFLFFTLTGKEDSKEERRKAKIAGACTGVLSLLSAAIALGALLFSVSNLSGWAYVAGCAVSAIFAFWYVDDD